MKVKHACKLLILFALLVCGLKAIILLLSLDTFANKIISNEKKINANDRRNLLKTSVSEKNFLLFWGLRWNRETWPSEGQQMDDCIVTYNRSKVLEAKALVFHSTNLNSSDFPWNWPRRQEQLYIWWNSETPTAVFREIPKSTMKLYDENFFNWTMTYRLSADVVWNYGYRGYLLYNLPLGKAAVDKIIAGKKDTAIMFLSNCESKTRIDYVNDMKKGGLSVTVMGKCFDTYVSKEEMDRAIRSHKFYLAFENALHCRDYITEKFWDNALKKDAVPVIMGPVKEDVLKVAPPNSFIFAEDFATPAELAVYLIHLDKNDEEYRKYLTWREDEEMTDMKMIDLVKKAHPDITPQEPPQRLCGKVLSNKETKIIKSLTETIVSNDPVECLKNY